MSRYSPNNTAGFSLLEVVIYFAIAVTLSGALATVLIRTVTEHTRLARLESVERSARLAQDILAREIRRASSVESPLAGTTSTILILAMATGTTPIAFSLGDGHIEITKGGSSPVRITSGASRITALEFRNASHADSRGVVRTTFTLDNGGINKNFIMTNSAYAR